MDAKQLYEDIHQCITGKAFVHEFETFAIDNNTTSKQYELRALSTESDISDYASQDISQSGITRILISRHEHHLKREIRPSFPSYSPSLFRLFEERHHIPSTYQQIRTYANACGTLQRYTRRNEEGLVESLAYVLRVPHSPRHIKSIWSLALSWDAKTQSTFALFDGASDSDIDTLLKYLNAMPPLHSHPLTLPTIFIDILSHYKDVFRNRLERILYTLEVRVGITRGNVPIFSQEGIDWMNSLDIHTMDCNRLITSIIYLERSYTFIKDLTEQLMQEFSTSHEFVNDFGATQQKSYKVATLRLEEVAQNCLRSSIGQIHQTLCLGKRAQTMMDVIYILVAQRESHTTIEIAASARQDSSSMTAISVMTMVFLPATFVSSFFGMNFFQYDQQKEYLVTTKRFWLYWCITAPLTLVTILLFTYWVYRHIQKRAAASHTLNSQRAQSSKDDPRSVTSLDQEEFSELNGPCYPLL